MSAPRSAASAAQPAGGRRYKWFYDGAPKDSSAEKLKEYPEDLQDQLEAAYEQHKEDAKWRFSAGGHLYQVCFKEIEGFNENWIQQRVKSPGLWRSVYRVRTKAPASPSSTVHSSPQCILRNDSGRRQSLVDILSARKNLGIDFDVESGVESGGRVPIGALTGFVSLAPRMEPGDDLVARCIAELAPEGAMDRAFRGRNRAVWEDETGPSHKHFATYVTLPQQGQRDYASGRLKALGARFSETTAFETMPPAWAELGERMRTRLVLPLDDGGDGKDVPKHLLDDYVLLHCQATRVLPSGRVHKHVDAPLYGEVIVTVVLQGESTLRLWDAKGSTIEAERAGMQAGEAYCLFGKARAIWKHSIDYPKDDRPRFSLTYRYAPRSAVALTESLQHPPPGLLQPGALVHALVAPSAQKRHPAAYPALVVAGPDALSALIALDKPLYPPLDALAEALARDELHVADGAVKSAIDAGETECALILYLRTGLYSKLSPAYAETTCEVLPCSSLAIMAETSVTREFMENEKSLWCVEGSGVTNDLVAAQQAAQAWTGQVLAAAHQQQEQLCQQQRVVADEQKQKQHRQNRQQGLRDDIRLNSEQRRNVMDERRRLEALSAELEAQCIELRARFVDAGGTEAEFSALAAAVEDGTCDAVIVSPPPRAEGFAVEALDDPPSKIEDAEEPMEAKHGTEGEEAAVEVQQAVNALTKAEMLQLTSLVADGGQAEGAATDAEAHDKAEADADANHAGQAMPQRRSPSTSSPLLQLSLAKPIWLDERRFAELISLLGMTPKNIHDHVYREALTKFAFPNRSDEEWHHAQQWVRAQRQAWAGKSSEQAPLVVRHFDAIKKDPKLSALSKELAEESESKGRPKRARRG